MILVSTRAPFQYLVQASRSQSMRAARQHTRDPLYLAQSSFSPHDKMSAYAGSSVSSAVELFSAWYWSAHACSFVLSTVEMFSPWGAGPPMLYLLYLAQSSCVSRCGAGQRMRVLLYLVQSSYCLRGMLVSSRVFLLYRVQLSCFICVVLVSPCVQSAYGCFLCIVCSRAVFYVGC